MEELEKAGFAQVPWREVMIAVYVLVLKGEVVYVGQSRSIYSRLAQHYWGMGRKRDRRQFGLSEGENERIEFDEVWLRWANMRNVDTLEREMIHRFKPAHNRQKYTELPKVNIDLAVLALRAGVSLKERRRLGE